jgi:LmeA-like phospholipid-binding
VRRTAILVAAGVVLLVLVVAQLVLPGIAAQRLRDRLARNGTVLHVEVHAFPAIELLWHQADRVVIRMGTYQSAPGNLGSLLGQTADVGSLDASAGELNTGLLTLRNATLRKRGNQLTGSAHITESDLQTALPILQSVTPVASGNGQLTLRGTASLIGVTASVDATVRAQDGRLVVEPQVPLGGLATLTVFGDPHVAVQGVSAAPTPDGFTASAQAQLR